MKAWVIIIGSICLALGLYLSFESNRVIADKLYKLKRGQPEPLIKSQGSMDQEKKRGEQSDKSYNWGIFLTLLGIILNAVGSLM